MRLQLLPAVDVADGQAVRLVQGEAGSETRYGSPVDAALAWQRDGAEWIHLVDLDAAFGRGSNAAVMRKVIKSGFFWQFVGGFAIGAVGVVTLQPASAQHLQPIPAASPIVAAR